MSYTSYTLGNMEPATPRRPLAHKHANLHIQALIDDTLAQIALEDACTHIRAARPTWTSEAEFEVAVLLEREV